MGFAFFALLIAIGAAGWLLFRLAGRQGDDGARSMTMLKLVVWLALTAALLAAKLWPLALMVLLAAGGVAAIEAWRSQSAGTDIREAPPSPPARRMSEEEALSVLGLSAGASPDEIRASHRKLIAQLHPDKGGTDYLAAKINEARDRLLRLAGES